MNAINHYNGFSVRTSKPFFIGKRGRNFWWKCVKVQSRKKISNQLSVKDKFYFLFFQLRVHWLLGSSTKCIRYYNITVHAALTAVVVIFIPGFRESFFLLSLFFFAGFRSSYDDCDATTSITVSHAFWGESYETLKGGRDVSAFYRASDASQGRIVISIFFFMYPHSPCTRSIISFICSSVYSVWNYIDQVGSCAEFQW